MRICWWNGPWQRNSIHGEGGGGNGSIVDALISPPAQTWSLVPCTGQISLKGATLTFNTGLWVRFISKCHSVPSRWTLFSLFFCNLKQQEWLGLKSPKGKCRSLPMQILSHLNIWIFLWPAFEYRWVCLNFSRKLSLHHFSSLEGDSHSLDQPSGAKPQLESRDAGTDCTSHSSARQRPYRTENHVLVDKLTLLRGWMKLTHSWSIRQLAGIQQAGNSHTE